MMGFRDWTYKDARRRRYRAAADINYEDESNHPAYRNNREACEVPAWKPNDTPYETSSDFDEGPFFKATAPVSWPYKYPTAGPRKRGRPPAPEPSTMASSSSSSFVGVYTPNTSMDNDSVVAQLLHRHLNGHKGLKSDIPGGFEPDPRSGDSSANDAKYIALNIALNDLHRTVQDMMPFLVRYERDFTEQRKAKLGQNPGHMVDADRIWRGAIKRVRNGKEWTFMKEAFIQRLDALRSSLNYHSFQFDKIWINRDSKARGDMSSYYHLENLIRQARKAVVPCQEAIGLLDRAREERVAGEFLTMELNQLLMILDPTNHDELYHDKTKGLDRKGKWNENHPHAEGGQ